MTLPDTDSLSTLGGALSNAWPVVDPTTDLDADADNKNRCDVAMMTHTALRAWCAFTTAATTGALARVGHDAMWGNASAIAPALARTGAGTFTLTYPATVYDELGVGHALNFRAGFGQSRAVADDGVKVVATAPNVLTVYLRVAGVLADGVGTTIDVFAR